MSQPSMRDRMIACAAQVVARRGVPGTSFAEVLLLTGASRGSIYHHFPGGKQELIEAALDWFADQLENALNELRASTPAAMLEQLVLLWRNKLLSNDCEAGCAIAAAVLSNAGMQLDEVNRLAFARLHAAVVRAMKRSGMAAPEEFVMLFLSTVQGAIVLCRAEMQIDPYDIAMAQLQRLFALDSASAATATR
ncbi:MAG: TetR/AcrR family transcriptional regulator [Brachymonas denitrificans]|uniref:TetR/AcrR family transcriptional regulator n=1 Tax=Brachymonas denitrificans TaxID=28220 RepID=UPI00352E3FD7